MQRKQIKIIYRKDKYYCLWIGWLGKKFDLGREFDCFELHSKNNKDFESLFFTENYQIIELKNMIMSLSIVCTKLPYLIKNYRTTKYISKELKTKLDILFLNMYQ